MRSKRAGESRRAATLLATLCAFAIWAGLAGQAAQAKPAERWLPVDGDGWTVLRPAADSHIFYVSSRDGDDVQATTYTLTSATVGKDPTRPKGQIRAFKTIAAAMAAVRKDAPDWVLLRRGDTWTESLPTPPSGRDAGAPFVVGSYGNELQRPLLKTGTAVYVTFNRAGCHDIVLTGLEFFADAWDPATAPNRGMTDFGCMVMTVGGGGGGRRNRGAPQTAPREGLPADPREAVRAADGTTNVAATPNPSPSPTATPAPTATAPLAVDERILIEDCLLRNGSGGFNIASFRPDAIRNVAIRRSVIADSHGSIRSSGLWGNNASLLIEENVFDHNGWDRPAEQADAQGGGGQANMYSHNTYMSNCTGCVLRGNTFLRSSSIHNKFISSRAGAAGDILVENNLYVEGEIGIGIGGNDVGPYRFAGVTIRNNVMLDIGRSHPTGRHLAWYLEIADWDGGLVEKNLFLRQRSGDIESAYGILLSGQFANGRTRNVTIRDNIVDALQSRFAALVVEDRVTLENVRIEKNALQCPGLQTPLVCLAHDTTTTGLVFQGNRYWTGRPKDQWFAVAQPDASFQAVFREGPEGHWPEFGEDFLTFADWTRSRGEKGAVAKQEKYPDANRTVETYMASLKRPATLDAFVAAAREQSRLHWRKDLTAAALNDYIRAGFGR